MSNSYLPIMIILLVAGLLGLVIVGLSTALARLNRNPTPVKLMPYECGMDPVGDARTRFSVRFFLIGILFIVFDIELIFLFPWATIFKDLRVFGLVEMIIFVAVLFVGLVYVWKKGALEWE